MYRRIADIRTKEDAADVTDELIDRFGDVPAAVTGLIDIALIRSAASSYGVYEIKQLNDAMLLYIADVRTPKVSELMGKLAGRGILRLENKPYIYIRTDKYIPVLKILNQIFK